ncbi:hypothetical protein LINGRAHAP2_LOCUS33602 [Linum grandiflorum]
MGMTKRRLLHLDMGRHCLATSSIILNIRHPRTARCCQPLKVRSCTSY